MKKGDVMQVLEKNLNGWWRVKIGVVPNERLGKVPAVYLKKFNAADPVQSAMNAWDLFGSNDYLPPRKDFIDSKSTSSSDEIFLTKTQSQSNLSMLSIAVLPPSSVDEEEVYYVMQNYEDTVGDGLSQLKQGQRVVVLDKENASGWWYVRLDDSTQGWAPSAFLTVKQNSLKTNNF